MKTYQYIFKALVVAVVFMTSAWAQTDPATTITSITSSNESGSYKAGDFINVTVVFSSAIHTDEDVDITMNFNNGGSATSTLAAASGDVASLTFIYTVGAGDDIGQLVVNEITPEGMGSILDESSNAVDLGIPDDSLNGTDFTIDTIAPTISGIDAETTEAGMLYDPFAGVTFDDNFTDNPAVSSNPTVDTLSLTAQMITYTVTDDAGNTTTADRVVTVVDTTEPTISGIDAETIEKGSSFDLFEGVTVSDNSGEDLTPTITGAVNTMNVGPQVVTYTARDSSNNSATEMRVITVVDTTAPTHTFDFELTNVKDGDATITHDATQTVTVMFNEVVTDFTADDITVQNGSVVIESFNAAEDFTSYTFDVTATSGGAVSISLPGDALTDLAGNNNTATTDGSEASWTYEPNMLVLSAPTGEVEEGQNAQFTVSMPEALTATALVTIKYKTVAGTAMSGDFMAVSSGTAVIGIGASSTTVDIPVTDDSEAELAETFSLEITEISTNDTNVDTTSFSSAEATIALSDPAVVTVAEKTAASEESGEAVFTVSLSNAVDSNTTVTYSTELGDNTESADITVVPGGTVMIEAGQSSADVTVTVTDDNLLDDGAESFSVMISAVATSDAALQDLVALSNTESELIAETTITDNDTAPVFAISNAAATDEGTVMSFDFSLTGSQLEKEGSGSYTITGVAETDVSASDGNPLAGTFAIPAESNAGTISFAIVADAIKERDEALTLTVSSAGSAMIGTGVATGVITDTNSNPTVSISSVAVSEEDATATLTVSLTGATSEDTMISYSTTDNTATAGSDYTAANSSVTIPAGQTSTTIDITITNDSLVELSENFAVNLSDQPEASLVADGDGGITGVVTIMDDEETPLITITADSASGVETATDDGDSTIPAVATFTVSLPDGVLTSENITVAYSVGEEGDSASPADYSTEGSEVTIIAGQSSATITVALVDDAIKESDEQFTVTLEEITSGSGVADISDGAPLATFTILDDEEVPSIAIAGPSEDVTEAETASFTVTLSGALSEDVYVAYSIGAEGDSAEPMLDYAIAPETASILIAAGNTSAEIAVDTLSDELKEATESFTVFINDVVDSEGASISLATIDAESDDATANILDISDIPVVSMASPTVAVDESKDSVGISVTLSGQVAEVVTIPFTLTDGTALASILGSEEVDSVTNDYNVPSSLEIEIPAGSTTGSITIDIVTDLIRERDEDFTVTLGTPSSTNNLIALTTDEGQDATVVTIQDDTAMPTLALTSSLTIAESADAQSEAPHTAELVVSLEGGTVLSENLILSYDTVLRESDLATAADFVPVDDGQVTLNAGESEVSILIAITDDSIKETDETFAVTVDGVSGGGADLIGPFSSLSSTVTIEDDEETLTIGLQDTTITVPELNEDDSTASAVFTVELNGTASENINVQYIFGSNDDTAVPDGLTGDYQLPGESGGSYTVTIPAGSSSADISVMINDDQIREVNETFTLMLTSTNSDLAELSTTDLTAVATITDDESNVEVSVADATATEEGSSGAFAISLSGPVSEDVVVTYSAGVGGDTATDADYAVSTQSVTISAGDTSAGVAFTTTEDSLVEGSETFTLTLASVSTGEVTLAELSNDPESAQATITDNEPVPTVTEDGVLTTVSGTITGAYTIPDSYNGQPITSIGTGAFADQDDLTEVFIPYTVTTIEEFAFNDSESLAQVTFEDNVIIDEETSEVIEDRTSQLTSIEQYAFFNTVLTSLDLPDALETIGEGAFLVNADTDSVLTSIELGDSVETIGDFAFANADLVTTLILPETLTSLGNDSLGNMESLTTLRFLGDFPQVDDQLFESGSPADAAKVYFNVDAFQGFSSNSNYTVAILEGEPDRWFGIEVVQEVRFGITLDEENSGYAVSTDPLYINTEGNPVFALGTEVAFSVFPSDGFTESGFTYPYGVRSLSYIAGDSPSQLFLGEDDLTPATYPETNFSLSLTDNTSVTVDLHPLGAVQYVSDASPAHDGDLSTDGGSITSYSGNPEFENGDVYIQHTAAAPSTTLLVPTAEDGYVFSHWSVTQYAPSTIPGPPIIDIDFISTRMEPSLSTHWSQYYYDTGIATSLEQSRVDSYVANVIIEGEDGPIFAENVLQLPVEGVYTATANFLPEYEITLDGDLIGFSISRGKSELTADNSLTFTHGTEVTFTADSLTTEEDEDTHVFLRWTGSAVDAASSTDGNSLTLTVDDFYTLGAVFIDVETYEEVLFSTVTFGSDTGGGSVTAVHAGNNDGPLSSGALVPNNCVAEFTATADARYVFTGWLVNGVAVGTSNPLYWPISEDTEVLAIFDIDTTYSLVEGEDGPVAQLQGLYGYAGGDTYTVPSSINESSVQVVESLGNSAEITTVIIPDTVQTMSIDTFAGLTALEKVIFEGSAPLVIAELDLPAPRQSIEAFAFTGVSDLSVEMEIIDHTDILSFVSSEGFVMETEESPSLWYGLIFNAPLVTIVESAGGAIAYSVTDFGEGYEIALSVVAEEGYTFIHWTGDLLDSRIPITDSSIILTIEEPITVGALFLADATLTMIEDENEASILALLNESFTEPDEDSYTDIASVVSGEVAEANASTLAALNTRSGGSDLSIPIAIDSVFTAGNEAGQLAIYNQFTGESVADVDEIDVTDAIEAIQAARVEEIKTTIANGEQAVDGLFTEESLKAISASPSIDRKPDGSFTYILTIEESSDLQTFTPFDLTDEVNASVTTSVGSDGKFEVNFTPGGPAAFYKVVFNEQLDPPVEAD